MSKLLLLAGFLVVLSSAEALKCYNCENKPSDEECNKEENLVECPFRYVCKTTVRIGTHIPVLISKYCAPVRSCLDDQVQNRRKAWLPTQCNTKKPSSVCRCCCNTPECNRHHDSCFRVQNDPEQNCLRIGVPEFGTRTCRPLVNNRGRTAKLGTVCSFSCDKDHRLFGRSSSVCVRSRDAFRPGLVFNNPLPRCVPKKCDPPSSPPRNGIVNCSDKNNVKSICTYTCVTGFILTGNSRRQCRGDSTWSSRPPSCRPIKCNPSYSNPDNGDISCTNGNFFGSECRFVCNEGYNLNGSPSAKCIDDFDGNVDGVWSHLPPTCIRIICTPPHGNPSNGEVTCSDSNNEGSNCEFLCDDGYFLQGSATSTCTDDGDKDNFGIWTTPPPSCIRIICNPPHAPPTNGGVSCSNKNYEGSECEFSCDVGYYVDGSSNSVCEDDRDGNADAIWSQPAPICLKIVCNPPHSKPDNGDLNCSDDNNEGSVCSFTCNAGFYLDGSSTSVCQDDRDNDSEGVWSELPPVCIKIVCTPPHKNPSNGNVTCTNFNNEGSVCSFSCKSDYYREGSETSVCEHEADGEGIWNKPAPMCKRITCEPPQTNLNNGLVFCSDSNNAGSECEFVCNIGYALNGSTITECVDDGDKDGDGIWNRPTPTCIKILCNPPHKNPGNGSVSCTDDNSLASVCSFSCDAGHYLDGVDKSTCQDDRDGDAQGFWSNPAPVCPRIKCNPVQIDPTNGTVSCSDGNFEGSLCRFLCNVGYYVDGSASTTCLDDEDGDPEGVWSDPPPKCSRVTCIPRHTIPTNGNVFCVDDNYSGSLCEFVCRRGYDRIGSSTSICQDDRNGDPFGVWSSPPATCRIRTCEDPPSAPENGFMVCTKGNLEGSQCEYGCHGYRTRIGPLYSTCVSIGDDSFLWDNPAPICQINRCPEQSLRRGEVTCDDTLLRATTTCMFECTEPSYVLYPTGITENSCLNDTTWSIEPPCCTRPCPPYAEMDLVIVLDSSSSITAPNWVLMTEFVRKFIRDFQLGPNLAQIGVFRYNNVVDKNTQILLNQYPNNQTALIEAFNKIPYNGQGTATGRALVYARNELFISGNGNRPHARDVILVITDGKAFDQVKAISDRLRKDNVLIIVLGIESPGSEALDRRQLLDIAGSEENLVIASQGFIGLDERLAARLGEQVCGDPCAVQDS